MEHALAEVNGLIFAAGGYTIGVNNSADQMLNTMECYNPSKDTWRYVCSLSFPREELAMASLGGSIYAVGGSSFDCKLNTVERDDVEMDQWFPCPPTSLPRSGHGLVVYDGCLYACGGDGPTGFSMEKFTPSTQKWEVCPENSLVRKSLFGHSPDLCSGNTVFWPLKNILASTEMSCVVHCWTKAEFAACLNL